MRLLSGGVAHLACIIEDDLVERDTDLQKPHLKGLSDLVATVLSCRSVNSSEWASILPRNDCDSESKQRYIRRFLSNKLINPLSVMG